MSLVALILVYEWLNAHQHPFMSRLTTPNIDHNRMPIKRMKLHEKMKLEFPVKKMRSTLAMELPIKQNHEVSC